MKTAKKAKKAKKAKSLAKERSLPKKKQKKRKSLEPWSRIFDEAEKRHETQLNALINEYEGDGDSENVARVKAENALLPVYNLKIQKDMIGWNRQN